MIKLEALEALKAKVEAGTKTLNPIPDWPRQNMLDIVRAANGSLDAAMALHNAVLPEFVAQFDTLGYVWVYIPTRNAPPLMEARAFNEVPARALVIADLEILIKQEKEAAKETDLAK